MVKVKVRLRPIASKLNLPTVLKTTVLPGDSVETLFIATQPGEIFYINHGGIKSFLDIRSQIIKLRSGYDERGLLGLAFHPDFHYNGLFYLHYSVAGTQGPGALSEQFKPNPCDPKTLNQRWTDRETKYDHIDTVEEWIYQPNGRPQKRRTLLNLRRPFFNHNGVNSLNFSPETRKLVLTTGDGGAGFDHLNLSQDDREIAGKIIEIDVSKQTFIPQPPVVSRFDELPIPSQEILTVIAKGVRNIPGIAYQKFNHHYIKYVGNVGQDVAESIFSFVYYKSIPVTQLVQGHSPLNQDGFINFGWRGWEGALPTSIVKNCKENSKREETIMAYYNEAIVTSSYRLPPITSYFHKDPRPDKFEGTALTGVQPYLGNSIPELTGSVVFTDIVRNGGSQGVLAYTRFRADGKLNDFNVIETDLGSQPAYFVSLGTNLDQTRLYIATHGSMNVGDLNQGTVYELVR